MSGTPHTAEARDAAIERVLENLRDGMPEYAAAKAAGISYPTWYRWRHEIQGLDERQHQAKLYRVPIWEDALHKAALKGSVMACLALLEKYDKSWRDRAKEIAPQSPTFIFNGNAAVMIKMLDPEKKQKLLESLIMSGALPENVIEIGANGTAPK